jgi:hypothetical protein
MELRIIDAPDVDLRKLEPTSRHTGRSELYLMSLSAVPLVGEAQPSTERSAARQSFPSAIKRWLREPLLHFLFIGIALFAIYAYTHRGRVGVESSKQIVLSIDDLQFMEQYFESQWHRPPTPAEFQAMVEDKVKEEVNREFQDGHGVQ